METVFRERWEDPAPLSRNPISVIAGRVRGLDRSPDPLPEQQPAPPEVEGGTHAVQLLRTYPDLRLNRDYDFAHGGERSVARGYSRAIANARRLVYCVDPGGMFAAYADAAADLDAWHAGGRVGQRPAGRLRRLDPPRIGRFAHALAAVPYRVVHDPDGRPRSMRGSDRF